MQLTSLESSCKRTVGRNTGLMTYLLQVERGRRAAPKLIVDIYRSGFPRNIRIYIYIYMCVCVCVCAFSNRTI
jgi:hypothetical protein